MAQVTITIPDEHMADVIDTLSARWDYPPFLSDGTTPNPQTKAQFVRQRLAQYVRNEYRSHKVALAQAAVQVADVPVT